MAQGDDLQNLARSLELGTGTLAKLLSTLRKPRWQFRETLACCWTASREGLNGPRASVGREEGSVPSLGGGGRSASLGPTPGQGEREAEKDEERLLSSFWDAKRGFEHVGEMEQGRERLFAGGAGNPHLSYPSIAFQKVPPDS